MSLQLIEPPEQEPISRAEAKLHLKIDSSGIDTSPPSAHPDDLLIDIFIKATRIFCEQFQNRVYIRQTYKLFLDQFPVNNYIEIPLPPLICVNSIEYKDSNGDMQLISFLDPSGTAQLESDDYIIDNVRQPGRIYLKQAKSWPPISANIQAVQIEFMAGYGDPENVPENIKTAILLKVTDLYEHRGDETGDPRIDEVVERLLWPDRIIPI